MINSLRLQNFKNFRDVVLPLGPLTVIVGTNASGKSNLRDACRFLHGMSRGSVLADVVGEKRIDSGLVWRGIRGGAKEIATFGQTSFSMETVLPRKVKSDKQFVPHCYRHGITVGVGAGIRPLRVVRESFYRHHEMVYDSHPRSDAPYQGDADYLQIRLKQVGGQRRRGAAVRFLSDQLVLSQFVSSEKVPKEMHKYARNPLRQLQSMRFLDLSPEEMKKPSVPGQPLGDNGENLSSVLQAICEDAAKKEAMTEWIRELTPLDVVNFEFLPDQVGRILVALVEKNGQRTTAYSASDGTLRFLAMLAALMGPDSAQFYFLEEIDNGIHPTRLNLLLQLLEQHAKQGKVQIVTTTHSPQLLAMLSPEQRSQAAFPRLSF